MNLRYTLVLLGITTFLIATPELAAQKKEFKEILKVEVSAKGAQQVQIDAVAGGLVVTGDAQLSQVVVEGTATAREQKDLALIKLTGTRSGNTIRITCEIPKTLQATLDIKVRVPASLHVGIKDTSGSISVAGVSSAEISDRSGSIEVTDVRGDLRINDGSGSIAADKVGGKIWINDGSGDIRLRKAGSVVVDSDGSGSMSFEAIGGNVLVRNDGSGSISATGILGNFSVQNDGSGSITYQKVKGTVNIPKRKRMKTRRGRVHKL